MTAFALAPITAIRPQTTVKKVADLLCKSPEKVRELCRKGELAFSGKGRGFRIFIDSVAAYQERERLKVMRGRDGS